MFVQLEARWLCDIAPLSLLLKNDNGQTPLELLMAPNLLGPHLHALAACFTPWAVDDWEYSLLTQSSLRYTQSLGAFTSIQFKAIACIANKALACTSALVAARSSKLESWTKRYDHFFR